MIQTCNPEKDVGGILRWLTVLLRIMRGLVVFLLLFSSNPSGFSQTQVNLEDLSKFQRYNHTELSTSMGLKGDRQLTNLETERLVFLISVLADGRRVTRERELAAKSVGIEIGHISAIPVLKGIVQDSGEAVAVRYSSLTAISLIADSSIVPELIGFFKLDSIELRSRTHEQLTKLTRHWIQIPDTLKTLEERQAYAADAWKLWWDENKDSFKFDRSRMFVEH